MGHSDFDGTDPANRERHGLISENVQQYANASPDQKIVSSALRGLSTMHLLKEAERKGVLKWQNGSK